MAGSVQTWLAGDTPAPTPPAPRPPRDSELVVRLRRAATDLRVRGFDGSAAPAINYERPRVQTSVRGDADPIQLGRGEARDVVSDRLARVPDGRDRDTLGWLRATGEIETGPRESRDLRKLLDDARDDADLRPVRLALARSQVALAHVAGKVRVKWSKSTTQEGALTWAQEALVAAIDAWEGTGIR